jgi:hypothetical protein
LKFRLPLNPREKKRGISTFPLRKSKGIPRREKEREWKRRSEKNKVPAGGWWELVSVK